MLGPQDDDDALTWAGDEDEARLGRPVRLAPASELESDASPSIADGAARGGAVGLVLFGVLAGIALLETLGWARSAFGPVLGASLSPGGGSPPEVAAFGVNVVFRVAGVVAPLVWFGVVAWRMRAGARRFGWLAFGAVLLVPWPLVVAP